MKTQSIRILIVSIAMLSASGCLSRLEMDSQKSVLPAGIETTSVHCSAALQNYEEAINGSGYTKVPSGVIFKRVFTGGDDAPGSIDLINSRITMHMGGFNPLIPPTWWFTYTACVNYSFKGENHILSTNSNSSERISGERAAQEAVELAVTDLAKQVKAITVNN